MNPHSLSVTEEVSDELDVCEVMTEVYTSETSLFPKLYNKLPDCTIPLPKRLQSSMHKFLLREFSV